MMKSDAITPQMETLTHSAGGGMTPQDAIYTHI